MQVGCYAFARRASVIVCSRSRSYSGLGTGSALAFPRSFRCTRYVSRALHAAIAATIVISSVIEPIFIGMSVAPGGATATNSAGSNAVTALLPVLFVTVAPPGAVNIPMTIGLITLAICVVAAISAWTARETYRVHLNDLGDKQAVPVPKPEYDRIREQVLSEKPKMTNATA